MNSIVRASLTPPSVSLSALVLISLVISGCEEKAESQTGAPPARFEAALAQKKAPGKELEAFCDARGGQALTLPKLVGQATPAEGPLWVNVWATWCKACVEEMPMIERWKGKLGADVLFISTDEDPELLATYQKEHPNTPETARMEAPDELPQWLTKWGLDAGAGLPLHLFVGKDQKIKCVRAGAVAEHHRELVAELLSE